MSLSVQERPYFDANGFVAKTGLFRLDWIQRVKDEIEDLHDRTARDVVEGVGISWEEFGDQNMPNLILQLMHSELVSPTLKKMLRSDATLDIVEALMGRCVVIP